MTPNALCFGEELPATGAPCHVSISTAGLTVRFEDRVTDRDETAVPYRALTVSAGGLNHDQLVVKWGTGSDVRTVYLKDPAIIRAFRAAAPPELTRDLEETAAKVRQARSRQRTIWGVVLGAVGALALFLWLGSDLLVEFAVSRIPVEWEQKLGEATYRDFLVQQTVIKEGPAVAAVNDIVQRLTEKIPDNPYKFEVSVVKSDVVNAFALPGGYVVVFTGLMKKAESGEEVAGVLSHELNHVLQRHGLERIVKQLGLVAVVTIVLGDQQGLAGLVKQLGVELLTLKFGRAQETKADVTGLQLLHRAKIDPSGMIRFFERLSEKDKERVEILSTHPMSESRAARLKVEVAALPKQMPEPFGFDWKTVQETLGVPEAVRP
ncbi:MAG TPA: M48 family metallopeptidase [Nitrospira sp.]|nr:M48 family metallopeptidase [Nitrospira sp.]